MLVFGSKISIGNSNLSKKSQGSGLVAQRISSGIQFPDVRTNKFVVRNILIMENSPSVTSTAMGAPNEISSMALPSEERESVQLHGVQLQEQLLAYFNSANNPTPVPSTLTKGPGEEVSKQ